MKRRAKSDEHADEKSDAPKGEGKNAAAKGFNWYAIGMILLFGLPIILTGLIVVSMRFFFKFIYFTIFIVYYNISM